MIEIKITGSTGFELRSQLQELISNNTIFEHVASTEETDPAVNQAPAQKTAPAESYSFEDMQRVMGQMINNGKMDAVRKIMGVLGIESLTSLQKERYPELAELLKSEGVSI